MLNLMKDVYLTYVLNPPEGTFPSAVLIYAGLQPLVNSNPPNLMKRIDILKTDRSHLDVLKDLEGKISDKILETPQIHSTYEGIECRGYLALGSWPKVGESEEVASARAKKNTDERNSKILEIYKDFIKGFD